MTDLDLDELRRLTREATPGPWRAATDEGAPEYEQIYAESPVVDEYEADVLSALGGAVLADSRNMDLIIAMRNALLDLLDRIERLERVAQAARAGHVRTECGPCDHGLAAPCSCTPMDMALSALDD